MVLGHPSYCSTNPTELTVDFQGDRWCFRADRDRSPNQRLLSTPHRFWVYPLTVAGLVRVVNAVPRWSRLHD